MVRIKCKLNPVKYNDSLPEIVSPFINVYGNKHGDLYFMALRFKNPVIQLKQPTLKQRFRIPPETCVMIDFASPLTQCAFPKTCLVFICDNFCSELYCLEEYLIKTLFQSTDIILFSTFEKRTLFVIARQNPFSNIWIPLPKSKAFHALVTLTESCLLQQKTFNVETAGLMRHFKRFGRKINQFSLWFPLMYQLTFETVQSYYQTSPSARLGNIFYEIKKRSHERFIWPTHAPPDFYTCQVTLSMTDPVGVACCIVNDKAEYVSVMIVGFTKKWYRDTCNVSCCFDTKDVNAQCRDWLPLFKNRHTWEEFGLEWYTTRYKSITPKLCSVLDWLSIQTAEPYRYIKTDLLQVCNILTGVIMPRWCY